MELIGEYLNGVKLYRPFIFEDERGNFVKPFHAEQISSLGIEFTLREEFYSTSSRNVLRGMHFQLPPHAHQKLIYCIRGEVQDVLLDLRKDSPTYGQSVNLKLSAANKYVVYVPIGFAHGFCSMKDDSCLVYKTDAVHAAEYDMGVLWNSFGHKWPIKEEQAIISDRDLKHISFTQYQSPF